VIIAVTVISVAVITVAVITVAGFERPAPTHRPIFSIPGLKSKPERKMPVQVDHQLRTLVVLIR